MCIFQSPAIHFIRLNVYEAIRLHCIIVKVFLFWCLRSWMVDKLCLTQKCMCSQVLSWMHLVCYALFNLIAVWQHFFLIFNVSLAWLKVGNRLYSFPSILCMLIAITANDLLEIIYWTWRLMNISQISNEMQIIWIKYRWNHSTFVV